MPVLSAPSKLKPTASRWAPKLSRRSAQDLGQHWPLTVQQADALRLDKNSAATEPHAAERDSVLVALFDRHFPGLVRLATALGLGQEEAEDVAAEAFCQLHRRWSTLQTPDSASCYLRNTVLNLSRMRLRHLRVVDRHALRHPEPAEESVCSAELSVIQRDDRRRVLTALQALSDRQRQALVLRYWHGLKEAEIAEIMGISVGAVKSHTSRGMSKLAQVMNQAA
ncbi:sigma-70 family RNA polymerase sigma factor [Kitasatospora sp. GP82]|uniref:RNA polymerase sigma factor n=1 Tax=Kitasatospora sp. GP82 TaxID=3035089 RepID=UPI0024733F6A|nr:sigma-70 family RNA polymerase sigma factor [Kitasatospora sp. GP82]MDH6128164.1 RNA polymerase sigma-70 factor (sigma-E family) [Kitasatospora sp. GP82]